MFPTMDQYQDAVQNPQIAFVDTVLKRGTVRVNGLGLPAAIGGGFVITYQIQVGVQRYAVRCFHRSTADLQIRYASITKALRRLNLDCFVEFDFQQAGISVGGKTYPIVKMDWVDDKTLGEFLETNHKVHHKISELRQRFADLERQLRAQGIAHGDIQNGNVLVGQKLTLVDYDGLYVPELKGLKGSELGHRHFQHPRRVESDFGPKIDRFSFIVIDLSLQIIEFNPMYFRYFNGENILFTAGDFENPSKSPLFKELYRDGAFRKIAEKFANVCALRVSDVPNLEEFYEHRQPSTGQGKRYGSWFRGIARSDKSAQRPVQVPEVTDTERSYVPAFEILLPLDLFSGASQSGKYVELVGFAADIHKGHKRQKYYLNEPVGNAIYINNERKRQGYYINIYFTGNQEIKVTFWDADDVEIKQLTEAFSGRWLSAQGMITSPVKEMGKAIPSMVLMSVARLRSISKPEFELRLRAKNDGARH